MENVPKNHDDINSDVFTQKLIDSLFAFVGVMTPEGKLLEANRTALEAAGIKSEDVIGKMFPDTYWWSYSKPLQSRLWKAIRDAAKGIPSRFDAQILVKDGEYRIIDFMLVSICNDEGKITYLVPSAVDITDRKNAEETYKENEARLAMANQAGEIGTWDRDLKSERLIWDEQMLKMFAYSPDSGFLKQAEDFLCRVHPEDKDRVDLEIRSALINGFFKTEFRILLPDGGIRWLLGHGRVFYDEDGTPKRMLGINRDITEEKRSIKLLEERENRLALALDVAQLGAFTWTTTSRKRQLSGNAKKIVGSEKDSLTWSEFVSYVHPADIEKISRVFTRGLEEHQDYSIEYRVIAKNGNIHWIWERGKILVDFLDLKVTGITGVIQDITPMKEAESNRRDNERQREAIERRDEFISIAAHELKTPISSLMLEIQMMNSLLNRTDWNEEKLRDLASKAERSVQNLTKLTNDLFDVTQLRSGKLRLMKEHMNLEKTLREEVESIKLSESSVAAIEIQADKEILGKWDRTRISQILRNLLKNALKYGKGSPVQISATQKDGFAVLTITDHGPGIPEELQHKIFDRFERANASDVPGGMGLGLYICQLLVLAHHGTLSVRSQLGAGASFIVRLPLNS